MAQIASHPTAAVARYELAQRFNLVAAQLADDQAYYMVVDEKETRNPHNVWNKYARPALQKRGVPIVWLNAKGERRGSVYPPEVIPPAVEPEPRRKGPAWSGEKDAKAMKSDGTETGIDVGSQIEAADLGKRLQLKPERAGMKGRGKWRGKRRNRRSIERQGALQF